MVRDDGMQPNMFSKEGSEDPTSRMDEPILANYSYVKKTDEENERFTTSMANEELARHME